MRNVFIFFLVLANIAFMVPIFVDYSLPSFIHEFRPIAQMIRCVSWGNSVVQLYLVCILFNLFTPLYFALTTDLSKLTQRYQRSIFSLFVCLVIVSNFYMFGFANLNGSRTIKALAGLFCYSLLGSFTVGIFEACLVSASITAVYVFCVYPIYLKLRKLIG